MASVEGSHDQLRILIAERQAMREREAGRDELESNRLELARRQRQLSRALHRPAPPRRWERSLTAVYQSCAKLNEVFAR